MPERICAIGRDGDAWARVLTAMATSMPVGRPSGAFALQRRALKGVNGALLSRAGMLSAGAASLRSGLTPIAVFRSGAGCQPTRIVEEPEIVAPETPSVRAISLPDTPRSDISYIRSRESTSIKLGRAPPRRQQRPRATLRRLPAQPAHMLRADPEQRGDLHTRHPSPRQRHDREVAHPLITGLIHRQRPPAIRHHHTVAHRLQAQLKRRRHPRQLILGLDGRGLFVHHPTRLPN